MKPVQFRLTTLLRLREAVRDERRLLLADALRVEAALNEQAAELDRGIGDARKAQLAPAGIVDVDRLIAAQRYELTLEMERRRLGQQQANVAKEIDQRRSALVTADQDVRVLEKLRDTQAERWRAEHERQQMKEMDEVAGRSYALEGRL
jgi:flagellar export protein FliJ